MSGAKNSKATDRSEVDCKSGQIEFDQVLSAYIARLPTLFLLLLYLLFYYIFYSTVKWSEKSGSAFFCITSQSMMFYNITRCFNSFLRAWSSETELIPNNGNSSQLVKITEQDTACIQFSNFYQHKAKDGCSNIYSKINVLVFFDMIELTDTCAWLWMDECFWNYFYKGWNLIWYRDDFAR